MIKFEIPYNLDPAYPEKLLQRPALIPYIDCIYAAAWKDDCDNTRFDITFRSDYPKTYEEYVERIKSLLALGIPVCILAQKKTTITMIRKYRALGIHQFILNDDKLAARIKQEYPEVRLTLSITRALTLSELQTGDYSMYDRIVLFHWFARHLEALQQLPTGYQYTMIANGMTSTGFLKAIHRKTTPRNLNTSVQAAQRFCQKGNSSQHISSQKT